MYYPAVSVEYCVNITDGDTFTTDTGERIRLSKFDAPERWEAGYWRAFDQLIRLIYGQYVVVSREAKDTFGRTIATVYLNGYNINQLMEPFSR